MQQTKFKLEVKDFLTLNEDSEKFKEILEEQGIKDGCCATDGKLMENKAVVLIRDVDGNIEPKVISINPEQIYRMPD